MQSTERKRIALRWSTVHRIHVPFSSCVSSWQYIRTSCVSFETDLGGLVVRRSPFLSRSRVATPLLSSSVSTPEAEAPSLSTQTIPSPPLTPYVHHHLLIHLMASAPDLHPWVVLDRYVKDADLVNMRDPKWAAVKCARKEAYGCGEFGQELVDGLTLYVRRTDGPRDLFSALAVRATDEMLRKVAAPTKIQKSLIRPFFRCQASMNARVTFVCELHAAEENLVVLSASFDHAHHIYYLVYDGIDESLTMIPSLSPHRFVAFHPRPVLRRRATGGYDLALIARYLSRKSREDGDVLLLFTKEKESSCCSDQWMEKKKDMRLPTGPLGFFCPDMFFSFKGNTFWVDLSQGFMCCDTNVLFSGDTVDFRHLSFPPQYLLHDIIKSQELGPMEMYRTMGVSGGSIKFVSINTPATDAAAGKPPGRPCHDATALANTTVAVWTLDQGGLCWKKDVEFRLGNIWSQRDYKQSGLPRMVPVWPFLRPHAHGTLYFLVPKPMTGPSDPQMYHICGLDMCTKKIQLSQYSVRSNILRPAAFPTNAFQHLDESPLATK